MEVTSRRFGNVMIRPGITMPLLHDYQGRYSLLTSDVCYQWVIWLLEAMFVALNCETYEYS
jgi:hypothetical protein